MRFLRKTLRLRERALAFATEEFRLEAIHDYFRRGSRPRRNTLALAMLRAHPAATRLTKPSNLLQ